MRSAKAGKPCPRSGRRRQRRHRRKAIVGRRRGDDRLGNLGSDAEQKLGDPKARHSIARVFGKAHERHRILDMRSVEKLEAPIFDERHVAAGELELERGAVVGGAKQHRLRLERRSCLTIA